MEEKERAQKNVIMEEKERSRLFFFGLEIGME